MKATYADTDPLHVPSGVVPGKKNALWYANYLEFKAYWENRAVDSLPDSHPHVNWVERLRARHRDGRLEPWKAALLAQIGFPLEAPRRAAVPTNLEYARQLVAYFQEHGHSAPPNSPPTQGLHLWCKRMRASLGTAGVVQLRNGVDQAADVEEANALLRAAIRDFTWDDTTPVHRRSGPVPSGRRRPPKGPRFAEVKTRAEAALRFPTGDVAGLLPDPFAWELRESQQACRVRVFGRDATARSILLGDEQPTMTGYLRAAPGRLEVVAITDGDSCEPLPNEMQYVGTAYSDDGGLRIALLQGPSGVVALDYDVCIDDDADRLFFFRDAATGERCRTNADLFWPAANCYKHWLRRPADEDRDRMVIDWSGVASGDLRPGRLSSVVTSAYPGFAWRIRQLKTYSLNNPGVALRWSAGGAILDMYKFLEHQLLKARNWRLPRSHLRQLMEVEIAFGMSGRLADLLEAAAEDRHGRLGYAFPTEALTNL